jgi:pimeloyl-ACP methyl ester carboxylesterase
MHRRVTEFPPLLALLAIVTIAGPGCAPSATPAGALDFATVRPAGELTGRWVGGTNVLGGYIIIEAQFRRGDAGFSGELRAPSENVSRLPVTDVELSGSTVAFTFHSPFGAHRAAGGWDHGMILGRIEGGGLTGDFHLLPVSELPDAIAASRAGSYTEGGSHHLLVVRRAGGVLSWAETDPLEDGALWIAGGGLFAYSTDTMFTDRSIRSEPRDREWAVFEDSLIEWYPETRPRRVTRRSNRPVTQEEVTFSSGGVTLSGTLLLPPGDGPHPAVVLVHGSGPAERTSLLGMARADLLLRHGIAVLLYDKRGVGGSSGDWQHAGIEDLASDAAAGVALLRQHPRISSGAVGLLGHSQAGWVIPATAARGTGADFLIILSGGGVSPQAQEVFRARAEAASAGLSEDAAAELMAAKWRFAASGEGWDAYIDRVRAADPRIVALVEAPTDSGSTSWALTRRFARYDPVPDLQTIRVPVLVIFGADDDNVPVDRAAALWRESVAPSLLSVEMIPGVGHALVEQRPDRSVFPAAMVRPLAEWLRARSLTTER